MRIYHFWLFLLLSVGITGCGTSISQRPTPQPTIYFTPGPTTDVNVTTTAFAQELIPTEQPRGSYVVREGDTLESIALAFNTTVDAITITNRISDANVIFIGQPLIIPSLLSSTDSLSETFENPSEVVTPTP